MASNYAGGTVMLTLAAILLGWLPCLYIYRLTLHPLSKFPGPKLAGATRWYEFYYDVILKGQFTFHLQRLHKDYGPIVRISPEEIHIDDPDFYETLYAGYGRLDKDPRMAERFGNPTSVFVTVSASVHRMRRAALNPFFSKRSIVSFQHIVQDKLRQMIRNIAAYKGTGRPVAINSAYMALTGDVIMEYCFGYNFNHLDSKDFSINFHEVIAKASQTGHLAVQFPIVLTILNGLPEWFVLKGEPLFGLLFELKRRTVRDVRELKKQDRLGIINEKGESPNVIRELIRSDLPPEEKTDQRLTDEGQNFIGAGVSTTGWSLSIATFHIINNNAIRQKLCQELQKAIPDPDAADAYEWSKLERCEYLTACIKEGIRVGGSTTGRMPRLSNDVIRYQRWQIPPRTPVSMDLVHLFNNEDIFPDAKSYKPERWLGEAQTKHGQPVDKYWFGFMKGARACLGINLAWLEAYVTLAGIFRNFDLELFETDESDVTLKHDFIVPFPKLDSKGIRVVVK